MRRFKRNFKILGLAVLYGLCLTPLIMITQYKSDMHYEAEILKDAGGGFAGGELRVIDDSLYMFQIVPAKKTYKTIINEHGIKQEIYSEEWMNDIHEDMNRSQLRLLKGNITQGLHPIFQLPAKEGAWWLSADQQKIWILSHFFDNKKNAIINNPLKSSTYSLYKSLDAGHSFQQVAWDPHTPIVQILMNHSAQQGYLIGALKKLWRTADGGNTWQQILIPSPFSNHLLNRKISLFRNSFDAYYLDQNSSILWISNYMPDYYAKDQGASLVYEIPWQLEFDDLSTLKPIYIVKDRNIIDIKKAPKGLYFLTTTPDPYFENKRPIQAYFIHWANGQVIREYQFDENIFLAYLSQGKDGLLVADGHYLSDNGWQFQSILMTSKDGGQHWSKDNLGGYIYASYFEQSKNKLWLYKIYKLYSKQY